MWQQFQTLQPFTTQNLFFPPTTMENVSKETRLQTAAAACKRDPHIPIAKLAKMYHVPDNTLRCRINGIAPERGSKDI